MDPANIDDPVALRAVGLAPEARKRLEAWLSLPDGDRAELIEGRIVYKAMTSIAHGGAILGIAAQLGGLQGASDEGGGGWWLSQDVDMVLSGQGVRPDLVGWRIDKNPRPPEKINVSDRHLGVYVAPPDWVCEVLSGSTRARDVEEGAKWQAYYDAGVGHYWLVDLQQEELLVYRRGARSYEQVEVARRDEVKPLPPFASVDFVARRVFVISGRTRPVAR